MEKVDFIKTLLKMSKSKVVNSLVLNRMDSFFYDSIINKNKNHLRTIQMRRYRFTSALLNSSMKNIQKGYISSHILEKMTEVFVENTLYGSDNQEQVRARFLEKYHYDAPYFITLSPTQECNLRCTGCYASSDCHTSPTLPYEVVDRIVGEVHDLLGSRFIVISGGEPFIYKSEGKTLLDIFKKYNDIFFMIYTNGTLITSEMAAQFAELGNVSPAISVEGYETETNERRGEGVFAKILSACENLKKSGVPFGISVTSTSKNINTLLTDEFYDFYFEKIGATYMWQFQFMPIGRGKEAFSLMISPEQRVALYRKWEIQLKDKKHPIADFWNSGVLTYGCVAYGGNKGYIYIDWNGNVMPCVFVPYYKDNIMELYKNGKTIVDALNSDFMTNGRQWQNDYAVNDLMNPGNLLMPCSIRDHYDNFRKNIIPIDAAGENEEADSILNEPEYYKTLTDYDNQLAELTDKIWDREFLNS